jgi:DNA-binding MurR/RpiR family transcriptional regulator
MYDIDVKRGIGMGQVGTFAHRVAAVIHRLSTAEQQVVRFFQANREEVLVASAAALAAKIGTSDATIIRAAKALGYSGLDDLRRQLADELRTSLSPAARLTRTLQAVKSDASAALGVMVDIHLHALEQLRQSVSAAEFKAAIDLMAKARRIAVFGIGPSSALADYFTIQLRRFGIESASLTQTGLLLADGLHRLRKGDLVVALAYSRPYREIEVLLAEARRRGASTILLTDSLGATLGKQVDLILPVERGNADWFSTHTATLGLIEALLVGLAAKRPAETIASLKDLNALRSELAGQKMELPITRRRQGRSSPAAAGPAGTRP